MDEKLHQQMVFEANRKSVGVAYLLWIFLGVFGAHRFYAGKTKSGIVQLLLLFSFVGWIVLFPWLLADLILIPEMIRDQNMKTINSLTYGDPNGPPEPARPKPVTEADRKREAMLEDLRQTGYTKPPRDTSHLYR